MYRPWFGSCTRAALALESSFAQFIQYLYKLVLLLLCESIPVTRPAPDLISAVNGVWARFKRHFFRGQVNLFWATKPSQQYRLCTNISARGTTFHTPNWTSMHLAVYFGPVRNLATLFFWTWPGFWRSWEKDAKREFWGPFMFFSRVYSLGMLGMSICDRGPLYS